MIWWPWSRIRELELALARAHERNADYKFKAELFRASEMRARQDLRGAHKGIKRLKDKLKKVTR